MDRTKLGREFYELGLRLGALGTVAIGSGGGSLAQALARAAGCGAALAGGEVKFHDGGCAACGTWLAQYYGFAAALFVRQEGERVELFLTDGQGKRFTPAEAGGACPASTGEWDLLAGADCAWAAHQAGEYRGELGTVCASGPAALTLALERLGYEVSSQPIPGAAVFQADQEGFSLQVTEGGAVSCPGGEDALSALADYTSQPQAVPAFRPREAGGGTA
ncbi:MAG: hypothetical protein HDT38_02285 [Clostridiales bacterium]|nr:hypothetical protein [Clostridiales bacterium]